MTKTVTETVRAGFLYDQSGRRELTTRQVNSVPLLGDESEGGSVRDADGREVVILEPTMGVFNVKEYGATGNGVTDDTTAINNTLAAAKGGITLFPPGEYFISSTLKVPEISALYGSGRRATVLTAHGEFNLLELGASDIEISTLFLKCASPQTTKGAAIDYSKCLGNVYLDNIQFGSNFFNGLSVVGSGVEMGNLKFRRLYFAELSTGVKSYHNAAIVLGSTTHRCVAPSFSEIMIFANTKADIPKAFEVNNTDSLQIIDCLMQTCEYGLVVGNNDGSALQTTNLYAKGLIADKALVGFKLSKLNTSEFANCHSEGCAVGIAVETEVYAVNLTGGSVYLCESHGIKFQPSVSPTYSVNITGMHIIYNGTSKEAGIAGVFFEEKSGGALITGCTIGNPGAIGEQKYGILLGKKTENIGIYGNRFNRNGTEPVNKKGEEVNINGKAAPTFAELEPTNMKA